MSEFTKEELYKLAEENDIKVDKRWNLEKLHEVVEAALLEKHDAKASTDETVEVAEEAPEESFEDSGTLRKEAPEAEQPAEGPQEVEVLSRLEWNHKVHLKGDKAKLPKELATLLISQGVVK